jgi:hypothetical protein
VSVPVRTGPSLELGTPAILFTLPEGQTWRDFAVSADSRRFLSIVSDVRASEQPLTVVIGALHPNIPTAITEDVRRFLT